MSLNQAGLPPGHWSGQAYLHVPEPGRPTFMSQTRQAYLHVTNQAGLPPCHWSRQAYLHVTGPKCLHAL